MYVMLILNKYICYITYIGFPSLTCVLACLWCFPLSLDSSPLLIQYCNCTHVCNIVIKTGTCTTYIVPGTPGRFLLHTTKGEYTD